MSIEQWWPKLRPPTREWLIENYGDAVSAEVVAEITAAGGAITSDGWWVGQSGPSGFYISDEGVDWIEAIGGDEDREPSSASR